MKKAIFLGVAKIHSQKKNQDYRKVDLYTPPFKDAKGFERGGVMTCFTALDSKLGEGIELGAIVKPEFEFDPYSNQSNLTAIEVVQESPYDRFDFDD